MPEGFAAPSIFIEPPIAIARVGGSTVPQAAYLWVESPDPRSDGETTIIPAWSLDVLPDGSVSPVVNYLSERAKVSDSELKELERLVERLQSKRKGD